MSSAMHELWETGEFHSREELFGWAKRNGYVEGCSVKLRREKEPLGPLNFVFYAEIDPEAENYRGVRRVRGFYWATRVSANGRTWKIGPFVKAKEAAAARDLLTDMLFTRSEDNSRNFPERTFLIGDF